MMSASVSMYGAVGCLMFVVVAFVGFCYVRSLFFEDCHLHWFLSQKRCKYLSETDGDFRAVAILRWLGAWKRLSASALMHS